MNTKAGPATVGQHASIGRKLCFPNCVRKFGWCKFTERQVDRLEDAVFQLLFVSFAGSDFLVGKRICKDVRQLANQIGTTVRVGAAKNNALSLDSLIVLDLLSELTRHRSGQTDRVD